MLRLEFTVRRTICRSLFLLLGVTPLLGSIAYATWQHFVADEAWLEAELASLCGIEVRVEQLSHPVPGALKLPSLSLLDPETGEAFATGKTVLVQQRESSIDVHFESLRCPAQRMTEIWRVLHDRLLKQRRLLLRPLIVTADRVTIVTRQGELELRQLRVNAQRHEWGAQADIRFTWSKNSEYSPRICIARRTDEMPVTRIRVATGAHPLPCAMFFSGRESVAAWATDLSFEGIAWIETDGQHYSGDVAGYLSGLDLHQLTAAAFPFAHGVRGTAAVRLEKAIFQDGRFDVLQARVTVGPGQIDADLLQSMKAHLALRLPRNFSVQPPEQVDFDQLDLRFRMNADGLVVLGMCDSPSAAENGSTKAMMVCDGRPFVLQPATQPQPCAHFIRALGGAAGAFENDVCVQLLSWLPRSRP